MGQPAAWTIANNAFPYRYFGLTPATVRQTIATGQVSRCSKAVPAAGSPLDTAISTKNCG
jgi:hypothetical protein